MDVEDAEIVTGTEVGLLAGTDPKAVFKSQEAVTATLEMIAAKVAGFEGDPSTAKGRQAIIAMASKVTRSKTALDKAGLQITEQMRMATAAVNAQRKRIKETLESLADQIRQPVTDWEDAEKARIRRHEEALSEISTGGMGTSTHSAGLQQQIDFVQSIEITDAWEEFTAQAALKKDAVLMDLRGWLAEAREREAELDRIRQKAEAEAREREAELDRIRQKAEAAAAEMARKEAEAQAEQEARERAADEANRARIRSDIAGSIAAWIGDMIDAGATSIEAAELLADQIMAGGVPHVSVAF